MNFSPNFMQTYLKFKTYLNTPDFYHILHFLHPFKNFFKNFFSILAHLSAKFSKINLDINSG